MNSVLEQTVYVNYHNQGVMLLSVGFQAIRDSAIAFTINNNIGIPVLYDTDCVVAAQFLPYWGYYESSQLCILDNNQIFKYRQLITSVYAQIPEIVDTLNCMFSPEISVSANSINFDTVGIGQTAVFNLYIDNTGTGILGVTSAYVIGPIFSVDFTMGDIYALDDSMLIVVTFSPPTNGVFADSLVIQSTAGVFIVPLAGVGFSSAVDENSNYPLEIFQLKGNYPNPFNSSTTLQFSLPFASTVQIEVFNTEGILVKSLAEMWLPAGEQNLNFDAGGLPSGLYFYRINAGNYSACAKMVIIR